MNVDKINSTCRVCLTEDKSGSYVCDSSNSAKYFDLIKEYTGLELIQHDNLPNIICDDCTGELMVVIKFTDKCRLSNNKLQEILDLNAEQFKKETVVKEEDIPLGSLFVRDSRRKDNHIKVELDDSESFGEPINYSDDCADDIITLKKKYGRLKKRKSSKNKLKHPKEKKKPRVKKEKEIFRCEQCNLTIPSRSALLIHNRKHTGERPYQCPTCQKTFAHLGTLKEHISRLHTEDKLQKREYVCDVCGKCCFKKADLVVHMRTHTKEKPYQCPRCPLSFAQSGALSSHIRLHNGDKRVACHVCGKRFMSHSALRRHMIAHTSERNYKCHICDKPLKSTYVLKNHIRIMHTLEKQHICDKCGAAFYNIANLRHHIGAKHSERSGNCEQCKRPYSNIAEHMRLHNGEKPFECEICHRKFTIQRSLTGHLIRHQNSNKFPCPHDSCTAAYSQQFRLDLHILKIHNKHYTHVCEICSRGFFRSSDLAKHLKANCCKKYKK